MTDPRSYSAYASSATNSTVPRVSPLAARCTGDQMITPTSIGCRAHARRCDGACDVASRMNATVIA
jgi:hypothetical protein